MALRACMFERPIPASDHLRIASRVVHRFSPCVDLTKCALSFYHLVPPAFFALTEKKTLVAREQDQEARTAWREQARWLASQDLVFVDETGAHIAMTPLYAYAPRGQRAYGKVPRNYGANTTLMASLSRQGMCEALILEGAADAVAFELYIEQILAPSLHSGQIVIMDNL